MDYTPVDYYNEMVAYYYRADCFHTMRNPDQDATSGNHHVINATHHYILKKLKNKALMDADEELYSDIEFMLIEEHTTASNFIESTRNKYGWFDRHSKKMGDRQAHDDNIGIIVSSRFLGLNFHKEIYAYGNKWTKGKLYGIPFALKWYYTNQDDLPALRLNAWHGRFPWLTPLYKLAEDNKIGFFGALGYSAYLYMDILFNKDKGATSGRILKWLMNSQMRGKSKIVDYAIGKWEDNIKKMYPDGHMGEVLGIYHGRSHPFSKIMWGRM